MKHGWAAQREAGQKGPARAYAANVKPAAAKRKARAVENQAPDGASSDKPGSPAACGRLWSPRLGGGEETGGARTVRRCGPEGRGPGRSSSRTP